MIKALAHICLLSSDLPRTLDFYVETLGLTKKFDFFRHEKWFGFYLQIADRQFLEVFEDKGGFQTAAGKKSITHLCLEVEDLAALRARLLAHDRVVTDIKLGADQSWQMWTQDPDGIDLEFHQYTALSHQFTGEKCLAEW